MEKPPGRNTENGSEREASASFPPTTNGGGESLRSELSRLLYRPLPVSQSEKLRTDESSLSVLPWKIDCKMPKTIDSSGTRKSLHFPAVSYLDLRRLQNTSYADSQCIKAQAELEIQQSNPVKFWKQALQLVPDHLPSLVAYARYLLDCGKLEASEDLLQQAVAINPKLTVVQELRSDVARLRQLRSQRQIVLSKVPFANHGIVTSSSSTANNNLTARESSAYQDALMERQLLDSPKGTNDNLATEEDSESYREKPSKEDRKRKKHRKDRDRRKRKRKERRRHKRRKRHRRRRHDSSDESSRSSSEDDGASYGSKDSNKSNSSASRQEHSPRKNSDEANLHESDKEDRRRKRRKRRGRNYDVDHRHKSRSKKGERKRYRKERKYSTDDSSTSGR